MAAGGVGIAGFRQCCACMVKAVGCVVSAVPAASTMGQAVFVVRLQQLCRDEACHAR